MESSISVKNNKLLKVKLCDNRLKYTSSLLCYFSNI